MTALRRAGAGPEPFGCEAEGWDELDGFGFGLGDGDDDGEDDGDGDGVGEA